MRFNSSMPPNCGTSRSVNNIHRRLLKDFQRLFGRRGRIDPEPSLERDIAAQVASRNLVVHHQDGEPGWLYLRDWFGLADLHSNARS